MRYKVVADILREVIDNRPYCPQCKLFVPWVGTAEGSYQSGTYHKACGCNVYSSDIIDEHEEMLKAALGACEEAIADEENDE